jgi:hypothetical protein
MGNNSNKMVPSRRDALKTLGIGTAGIFSDSFMGTAVANAMPARNMTSPPVGLPLVKINGKYAGIPASWREMPFCR